MAALPRGFVWVICSLVQEVLSKPCFRTSDRFFPTNACGDFISVFTPRDVEPTLCIF